MRAGSLDAIIVYEVNVVPHPDHFDRIPLPEEFSKAVQPFAVRSDSPNARLAGRLLGFIRSRAAAFEAAGFRWRGDGEAVASDQLDVPPWLK
jgi:hypothetical protein